MSETSATYASEQVKYYISMIDRLLNPTSGITQPSYDVHTPSSGEDSSSGYPVTTPALPPPSTPQHHNYNLTPFPDFNQGRVRGTGNNAFTGDYQAYYAHALDWTNQDMNSPLEYSPSNRCYTPRSVYHRYNTASLAQIHEGRNPEQTSAGISPADSASSESLEEPASPLQSILSLPVSTAGLNAGAKRRTRKRRSHDSTLIEEGLDEGDKERRRMSNKLAQRACRVRSKMTTVEAQHHLHALETLNRQQTENLLTMSSAIQQLQRENQQLRAEMVEDDVQAVDS